MTHYCTQLLPRGGSRLQPGDVGVVGRGNVVQVAGVSWRRFGARVFPLVYLRVAIGKGETASARVVARGEVHDDGLVIGMGAIHSQRSEERRVGKEWRS